jgi:heme-degrading monooxygenase HmoA
MPGTVPRLSSPLRAIAFALVAAVVAGLVSVLPARPQARAANDAVHQLRIYEIFEGNKAAFHARFRDHAARIMRKHGFDIVAMWEAKSSERTEFVYILRWPDQAAMDDRWAKFMADQEWADIKKQTAAQHGALVGKIESRVLRLTDYSPAVGH